MTTLDLELTNLQQTLSKPLGSSQSKKDPLAGKKWVDGDIPKIITLKLSRAAALLRASAISGIRISEPVSFHLAHKVFRPHERCRVAKF